MNGTAECASYNWLDEDLVWHTPQQFSASPRVHKIHEDAHSDIQEAYPLDSRFLI
jgi:hypothetical protein